jgi:dynein heavy chain
MMTNVISSAWEGISTVAAGVELLESFYHLAIRSGMKQSVERKTAEVYQMFNVEIKRVKNIFDKHKTDPPLPMGQPRYGGAALWARMLLMRIEGDMTVTPHTLSLQHNYRHHHHHYHHSYYH